MVTMDNSIEDSFKKIKRDLPYDPEIPLLGTYQEETIISKDTCMPMFLAALFTIARTWKEPKCPSTEEWIKKMWCKDTHTHTHNRILLSQRKTNILTHMWNLEKWYR